MISECVCGPKGCSTVMPLIPTTEATTAEALATEATNDWLETVVVAGFRVWQIMFLCVAGVFFIVIVLCCCIRFRIPRTKQEIEADYVRKKLTRHFQKQLRNIHNSEMDDMDLKRALERIRAEFKSDSESAVTYSSGHSPPSSLGRRQRSSDAAMSGTDVTTHNSRVDT